MVLSCHSKKETPDIVTHSKDYNAYLKLSRKLGDYNTCIECYFTYVFGKCYENKRQVRRRF